MCVPTITGINTPGEVVFQFNKTILQKICSAGYIIYSFTINSAAFNLSCLINQSVHRFHLKYLCYMINTLAVKVELKSSIWNYFMQ